MYISMYIYISNMYTYIRVGLFGYKITMVSTIQILTWERTEVTNFMVTLLTLTK